MKKKNSNGWGFRLINGIILAVISLMTLYPFLYVIFASFSDPVKLMGNSSLLLKPLGFSLNAYKKYLSIPLFTAVT